MASRAEQLKRLKQGEEAKKRVLSGASTTKQTATTAAVNPRTEALRNYVPPAVQEFKAPNTSDFLTSVGVNPTQFAKTEVKKPVQTKTTKPVSQPATAFKTPLATKLYAGTGDAKALADVKKITGFNYDSRKAADPRTQYQIEQENINNSKMPSVVKGIASVGNAVTRGNPVGRFLSKATTVPGVSMGTNDSTGNKVADKAGELLGEYVSPFLVPTGAPIGSGPMAAPYEAAGKLLNTSVGQKAVNTLGTGLSKVPFISANAGQNLAKVGLTEGIAGTIQNPASMLVNDASRSGKELATDAAIGGVAGAGLGMAGYGIGKGISAGVGKLLGKGNIPESVVADVVTPNKSTPIRPEPLTSIDTPMTNDFVMVPRTREQAILDLKSKAELEPNLASEISSEPIPKTRAQALQEYKAKAEAAPTVEPVQSANPYSTTTEDIPDFLKSKRAPEPQPVPEIIPAEEAILRPNQFNDNGGLGISAFGKSKPYESLKNDTRSQLVSRIDSEKKSLKGVTDKLYTSLIDDLHPLKQFDKIVEKMTKTKLDVTDSAHDMALNSRGSDVISNHIITERLVDANGKVVGPSLKEILTDMPKGRHSYVDFEDYLVNKHAVTRASRGEKVYRDTLEWTPEKGVKKALEYEERFPQFKTMADKLYEFNRNMVNHWAVDTGMITREQANAMFEANPFYVPNKRSFSELEKGNGGGARANNGFGNQSSTIKSYGKGGSQREIVSPIESMVENVDAFVKAAKRNKAMQNVVESIKKEPEALKDFIEIVKQPEAKEDITKMILGGENIDDLLARFSSDFSEGMQRTKLDGDNIVRVLIDGEPVHLKVNNKPLLDAITALGPQETGWMLNGIGFVTNKMKVLTTGANPLFSLTRNIMRDIPHAYVSSKTTSNPVRFLADLFDGGYQMVMNKELYKNYKGTGGGHSSSISSSMNQLKRSKDAVLPSKPLKGLVPKAYRKFENFINAVETAPRLGEFKRVSKSGTPEAMQKGMFAAQDLTVNFSRRGKLSKEIDKVFPYFNAAMQGIDQFSRMFKNNPVAASGKAFAAVTVPAAVLYALNYKDPNYQALSDRVKDNFFLIPKGDGTFWKIAKSRELGALFADVPERALRLFNEQDPEAFEGFAEQLRTSFLPPGVAGATKPGAELEDRVFGDTIFGPIANLGSNRNFAGAPIVPGYLSKLSPELQLDSKTSSIAKLAGEKLNYSPKKIDYLIKQYSGVIGQIGLPLLSPGGDIGSTLNQQVTADPVYSNDYSTAFYDYKNKLDQAHIDRNVKDYPEWYHDGLRKQLGKISDSMGDIRKELRAVQSDNTLSNKDKREQLGVLQIQINEMNKNGAELAKEWFDKQPK